MEKNKLIFRTTDDIDVSETDKKMCLYNKSDNSFIEVTISEFLYMSYRYGLLFFENKKSAVDFVNRYTHKYSMCDIELSAPWDKEDPLYKKFIDSIKKPISE